MVNKMLLFLLALLSISTLYALGVNIPAPTTNVTLVIMNITSNLTYLNLSGTNANQDLNIGIYGLKQNISNGTIYVTQDGQIMFGKLVTNDGKFIILNTTGYKFIQMGTGGINVLDTGTIRTWKTPHGQGVGVVASNLTSQLDANTGNWMTRGNVNISKLNDVATTGYPFRIEQINSSNTETINILKQITGIEPVGVQIYNTIYLSSTDSRRFVASDVPYRTQYGINFNMITNANDSQFEQSVDTPMQETTYGSSITITRPSVTGYSHNGTITQYGYSSAISSALLPKSGMTLTKNNFGNNCDLSMTGNNVDVIGTNACYHAGIISGADYNWFIQGSDTNNFFTTTNYHNYFGGVSTAPRSDLYDDGSNSIWNSQVAGSGVAVISPSGSPPLGSGGSLLSVFGTATGYRGIANIFIGNTSNTADANSGFLSGVRARGTVITVQPVISGDRVFAVVGSAVNSTTVSYNSAGILFEVDNVLTGGSGITQKVCYDLSADGTSTRVRRWCINGSGNQNFYNTQMYNISSVSVGNLTVNQNASIDNLDVTDNVVIHGNLTAKIPYGMFSLNYTQTMDSANTPYIINFTNTEDNYNINLVGGQNFTFSQSGDYLVSVSAIFSVDTPNKKVELWVQKTNATGKMANVIRSNTVMTLATSSTQIPLAVPFVLDLNTSDKIRFMMATDDAGSQLVYTTNTSYSPETPSIIVTFSKIGEITP